MARIIYGIQADGLGHYSRSKAVIDHLISSGHTVKVLTSERPYKLMKDNYDTIKIQRLNFIYKDNGVDYIKTIKGYIKQSPKLLKELNTKLKKIFKNFKPDVVISDVEILSAKTAIANKIPLIYIDNNHSVCFTTAIEDLESVAQRILDRGAGFMNIQTPNSEYVKKYFVLSFFKTKIKKNKKAQLILPIIRKEIINARKLPQEDHILVYQTSSTHKKLPEILKSLPKEKFIIYGFNKEKKEKNIEFKKTSVKDSFIKDIATCKAIITNGGFSLMTEGIFLHKPILSNPVRAQVEQSMNAIQLQKLEYGKYAKKITVDVIKSFIYDIENYKKNLESYKQVDNSEAFQKIDKEIELAIKNPICKKKKIRQTQKKEPRNNNRKKRKEHKY